MKLLATTWIRRVGVLAELLPRDCLHPAVLKWADSAKHHEPRVVSLSGGADSVTLLGLLWAHWPEGRSQLRAVHFNHRLRGRASDGDEKFCRELCLALGIPLEVGRRRPTQSVTSESQARDVRFQYIERRIKKHQAKGLWLGHQQNDVAETMLMRLSRGSGAGGLAAPRPVQTMPEGRVNLRPLLNLKRSRIEEALREAKLPWRDDATNEKGDFFRNRIRRDVLPNWNLASGRDALSGAALSRELIEEDDTALSEWADQIFEKMPVGKLRSEVMKTLPRAVSRRVLYRWLQTQISAGELSRQAFDLLLDRVQKGASTRQSLGKEGFAVIRKKTLYYEKVRSTLVKPLT